MQRLTTMLFLTVLSGAASAHELDHHSGLMAQLFHQLFAPHHLPFTVLLVVIAVFAMQKWRTARKRISSEARTGQSR